MNRRAFTKPLCTCSGKAEMLALKDQELRSPYNLISKELGLSYEFFFLSVHSHLKSLPGPLMLCIFGQSREGRNS